MCIELESKKDRDMFLKETNKSGIICYPASFKKIDLNIKSKLFKENPHTYI